MRVMIWFRSDLRVADNPALHAAARSADEGVVAVYTVCPQQWRSHDMAAARVGFVMRNLAALSEMLERKNVALRIIETPTFEGVPAALLDLAEREACDELHFNREYELNERERDEAVTDAFESSGRTVRGFTDQCLFEPGEVRTTTGGYYTVFTPFKKSWQRAVDTDRDRTTPLGAPRKQAAMVGRPDPIPEQVAGFDPAAGRPDLWVAGEQAALRRLRAFVADRLESYDRNRDLPAVNGTSALSPYLAGGVLSIRQCLRAALDANDDRLDGGRSGATVWISELVWREFYKHILVGFPRVCMHRAFQPATERLVWNDADEHFEAWCNGRTGYPIVDAAMRQLRQTGWMHNRLRMIVAMFLSKNLFQDWRRGERFFMQHLVDGDLAANNGGWQWAASTGTDAAPYFRVFNPCSQSKKCDPEAAFIRRLLPDLAGIETRALHDPSRMTDDDRAAADYPPPIVDHAETRRSAIAAFKQLSEQEQAAGEPSST